MSVENSSKLSVASFGGINASAASSRTSLADPDGKKGVYHSSSPTVQDNPNLVTGFTAPGYEEAREILEYSVKIGDDVGAGFSAYVDGELVIDIYGGHSDEARTKPYTEDTLSLVFSCSKPVAHIVLATYVDKGIISWDDPVAKYWPEFAAGNKQDVTIGDIVRHRGGIGYFDWPITFDLTEDLDALAVKLAGQKHNWDGKRTQSYSGMTGGYYVNEILRRVDSKHRTVGQIVTQDIMPKLNGQSKTSVAGGSSNRITEFHYALPLELEDRLSPYIGYPTVGLLVRLFVPRWIWTPADGFGIKNLITGKSSSKVGKSSASVAQQNSVGNNLGDVLEPAAAEEEVISPVFKQMLNKSTIAGKSLVYSTPVKDFPAGYNARRVRQSEHPSFSGVTNARSLATLAGAMSNGGKINGYQLLSQELTDKSNTALAPELDQCLTNELTMTLGGWASNSFKGIPGTWRGWSGAGGSLVLWEPTLHVGFSFVMNAMQLDIFADHRGIRLLKSLMTAALKAKELKKQSH